MSVITKRDVDHIQKFSGSQTMEAMADMNDTVVKIAMISILDKNPNYTEKQAIDELKKNIWGDKK